MLQIKKHCEKHDLGMTQIGDNNYTVILVGDKRIGETGILLVASHLLLGTALMNTMSEHAALAQAPPATDKIN